MKEFKTLIILLFFFLLSPGVFGQGKVDTRNYTARQLKNFGKNADRLGDSYTAIDFLEPYCKVRSKDIEMNYRLAELYFQSRDYAKAEKQFNKVYKDRSDLYPQALYYQAQSQKSQGKYTEAKETYGKFQKKLKSAKSLNLTAAALKEEIASCDLAIATINNPVKASIEHMNRSINSPHIELSPIPVNDSILIYASLKLDSTQYFSHEDTAKVPVRQFYQAKKEGNDWTGGKSFDGPINIPGVETGNGALSRDGNRFYFTRCAKTFEGKMRCEIFVSHRKNNHWQIPVKLNAQINDPNYTATQPTVGTTSKSNLEVLYFVSDRTGGRGGYDIWYSIYNPKKNEYAVPRNVGNKINTAGNEMSPFYDNSSRTLYFSSTGHQGLGGYDIFKSQGELRKWLDTRNMGYPINSSYDDLYFTINKSQEFGFLVSNRIGGYSFRNPTCCDDIYQYRWTDFVKLAVTGSIYPAERGKVGKDLDQARLLALKDSIKPMNKAVISLYMIDKTTKEKLFIDRDTTGKDGVYYFDLLPDKDYKFEMEGAQYFNEQVNLSTDGINFTYTVEMPPIWVNVIPTDKPIVLKNVYYEFNEANLSPASLHSIDSTLLELMQKASDIIVEVAAHTDSLGNAEYNKKLSQLRAENVVSHLVSKGINKKRLIAHGYGAEKPIAPNYKPDGSDNSEGRDQNRRTEFKVVGTLSSLTDDIDTEETQE